MVKSTVAVFGPLFMLIAKPVKLSFTFCPEAADGANRAVAIAAAANMRPGASNAQLLWCLITLSPHDHYSRLASELDTTPVRRIPSLSPLLERDQHRRGPGDVDLVADLDLCER